MTKFSLLHRQLLTAVGVLCATHLLVSQEAPGNSQENGASTSDVLVLKRTVRRVILDVVVRDADGKPVHGLSARDFLVSEDGKPQPILSFDVHEFDKPSLSIPSSAPALPPNTFVNVPTAPERGPLYAILYDMVNMEVEDQIVARQQVLKFIKSKPEGTRFAIYVHSDGLHLVQGFTDDRDRLSDILDPQKSRPHFPKMFLLSRNFGQGDPIAMMSTFTHITDFLNGLPGRKNLIWMAGSFPVALYPHQGDPQDLRDDIKAEIDGLARAQVAVYPLNVRGVVANPEGALTGVTPFGGSTSAPGGPMGASGPSGGAGSSAGGGATSSGTSNAAGSPPPIGAQLAALVQGSGVSDSLTTDYMIENDIATATGGRAFYSTNDLVSALVDATEDGGNYYSISYSPSNPNYDGSLRKIHVDLAGHGYHLEYRRSYYADNPDSPVLRGKRNVPDIERTAQTALMEKERPIYAGLGYGAPLIHQIIFKARIHTIGAPELATPEQMTKLAEQSAYFYGKGKHGAAKPPTPVQLQTYAIYYLVVTNQIKPNGNHAIPLEFAAVAFDSDGRVVNGVFENAADESSISPVELKSAGASQPNGPTVYRAMQQLDVPLNAVSIRVAVRDTSNDRVGALEIPLPLKLEPEVRANTPLSGPAEPSGSAKQN
jgi:VWFA-related protein